MNDNRITNTENENNKNNNRNKEKKEKRILLVDDEFDIVFPLELFLEENGFIVDTFTDPLLALSNFKSNIYDMGIIDIKMPKMDGFELFREIKKIDDKIKIYYFTASELPSEDLNKLSDIDKEQFILKPISMDDLMKKIDIKQE